MTDIQLMAQRENYHRLGAQIAEAEPILLGDIIITYSRHTECVVLLTKCGSEVEK